ncbi:hypothetical protein OAD19_00060 [Octadecabacter sp.]|nr:hypothetical protein [Octadecabacter sp.]
MGRIPNRIHAVAPREALDRVAFISAFSLGAGGGIALKALGAHPFVSATFAAFILILYAISAWVGGRIKIEPETIGDNCYYLGFLFTLASLSYTLYQLGNEGGQGPRAVNLPDVISGFGVALSSTIVGVFLRVSMMQLRTDFVAKDKEVRSETNQAFSDFRRTMSSTLSQMKAFSVESVQMAAERDEHIRSSTEAFSNDHQEGLKEIGSVLARNMEQLFVETSRSTAKEIGEILKAQAKDGQYAISALRDSIQHEKDEFLKEGELSIDVFKAQKSQLEGLLEATLDVSERQKAAAADLISTYESINSALIDSLAPSLETLSSRFDQLAAKIDKSSKELERFDGIQNDMRRAESGFLGYFTRKRRKSE